MKLNIDLTQVSDVAVAGINHNDAPDYVDAYIESADIGNRPATEAELNALNDDPAYADWKYAQLEKALH